MAPDWVSLFGLLIWQAGDVGLHASFGGFGPRGGSRGGGLGGAALCGRGAVGRRLGRTSIALRYGLANLRRHRAGNAIPGCEPCTRSHRVCLLTFTRNDLVDAWRRKRAAGRAQRFLLGRAARPACRRSRRTRPAAVSGAEFSRWCAGRLTAVNARRSRSPDFGEERAPPGGTRVQPLVCGAAARATTVVAEMVRTAQRKFRPRRGSRRRSAGSWAMSSRSRWRRIVHGAGTSLASCAGPMKVNSSSSAAQPRRALSGELHLGFSPRGRRRAEDQRTHRAFSEPHHRGCGRGPAAGARRHRPGHLPRAGGVRFRPRGGAAGLYSALVATEDERRREAAGDARLRRYARPGHGQPGVEFLSMGLLAGTLPPPAQRRSGSCSRAASSSSTCRPAPDCGSPGRWRDWRCSRSTPGCRRARCCLPRPH